MSAVPYEGVYRARALQVENGVITAYVPQVFGDTPITITDVAGPFPTGPSLGWVMFESGWTEFPVWTSGVVTVDEPIDYLTQAEADLLYLTETQADARYMTPAQADAAFLTPAEGDALFLTPAEGDALFTTPAEVDSRVDARYLLQQGQITSIAGLANYPPTVTVGGSEIQILGNPSNYAPFDTVTWIPSPVPTVIGRVPTVGSGSTPLTTYPWHVIGAAGEPAFQNSWVNYGGVFQTARFWRQSDGWVRLAGTVKNGSPLGSQIFVLPADCRPLLELYFTIVCNNAQQPLVVRTNGSVEPFGAPSSAFVSLDGVMFPSAWNLDQWVTPRWDNNWVGMSTFGGDFVYVYTRDDGMSYITGRMTASTSAGGIMELPERARINREGVLVQASTNTPAMSRYAIGGPSNGAWLVYQAGGLSNVHSLGGMTWFSAAGYHLENRWNNFPFAANWGPFDPAAAGTRTWQVPQYMKDHHGVVWLRGLAARSAATNPMGTLPVGFRPGATVILGELTNPDVFGRIDVAVNGDVTQIIGSTWQNLTGIHFRAEQ